MEKEILLEGLDCANCSAKIEKEVNALEGVEANINLVTKTLRLKTTINHDERELFEQVKSIVHKHEPDVDVIDKHASKAIQIEATLEGLSCANCAAKIEKAVQALGTVNNVSVDFVSKKLRFTALDDKQIHQIHTQVEDIVHTIEPDTKYILKNEDKSAPQRAFDLKQLGKHQFNQIIRFGTGILFFVLGLFIKEPPLLELSLFLIAYVIVGGDVIRKAFQGVLNKQFFSENFLMTIATTGAFIVGEYPEGVAVMLFYLVGEFFQDLAVDHSRKSIQDLMDIRPDTANLVQGNRILSVSAESVQVNDIILVRPGEKIPLDGRIIEGSSSFDTSHLTGESMPRDVFVDDQALGGFVNLSGVIKIEVSKPFAESTVAKILDLVQNASSRKAKTEQFITRFAMVYTPIVVFGAMALAFIPPLLIPGARLYDWFYRAMIFLVISCPCALVISIPLGFFGGVGGASKRGILVKGSNYLEALRTVKTIVFDKTGTLTEGKFSVQSIQAEAGYTNEEILRVAAHAESHSSHPIANSIMKAYRVQIDLNLATEIKELAGLGVTIQFEGKTVHVGNHRLMDSIGLQIPKQSTLGTLIHVAIDHAYAGSILIADTIKKEAKQAITDLKQMGIRTILLSGDLKGIASQVASDLGIDEVHAELLPQDKVAIFEQFNTSNKDKIAFVGDGINDAPVLARADIGIAMGGLGSDAAIEAADIVIMNDELTQVVTAMKIANKTHTIVYQNIFFALGVKAIFLILGAFGLASMWEAVFADTGVALIAIANAMRVMRTRKL